MSNIAVMSNRNFELRAGTVPTQECRRKGIAAPDVRSLRLPRSAITGTPRSLFLAVAILSSLLGCEPNDSTVQQDGKTATPTLPELVRQNFVIAPEARPYSKVVVLADPAGGVYYYGESDGTGLITRLDSNGTLLTRFGHPGQGPSELSGLGILFGT